MSAGGTADSEQLIVTVPGDGICPPGEICPEHVDGKAAQQNAGAEKTARVTESAPEAFSLDASTQNPTHTQATIRYALPEASNVTLTVYDVMGREVKRLVQSAKAAGFHEVQVDTSVLPSGTYLYRLRAGAFTETKRMVVVR